MNEKTSTMFPDSWSEKKVKDELLFAFENRTIQSETVNNKTNLRTVGNASEGINIEFYIDPIDQSYNFHPL